MAIHKASRECVWLRSVTQHIHESCGISSGQESSRVVHEDNVACIAQLKDEYIKVDKIKHILPKFFFTHDLQMSGDIIVQKVRSSDNQADLFTKALPTTTFKKLVHDTGMRRLNELKGISAYRLLANIIWDEEGKSEDHIVPYPNEAYEISRGPCGEDTKVSDKEDANVKLTKKTVSITDSQEGSSTHNERLATDRFLIPLNPNLFPRSNLDLQHIDEKGQEDNGSQFFDAQVEDREESNFVDYGWANVGNFEESSKNY
ncbi:hypothetical protein Tco_0510975 [Tanacetum coccineum]